MFTAIDKPRRDKSLLKLMPLAIGTPLSEDEARLLVLVLAPGPSSNLRIMAREYLASTGLSPSQLAKAAPVAHAVSHELFPAHLQDAELAKTLGRLVALSSSMRAAA